MRLQFGNVVVYHAQRKAKAIQVFNVVDSAEQSGAYAAYKNDAPDSEFRRHIFRQFGRRALDARQVFPGRRALGTRYRWKDILAISSPNYIDVYQFSMFALENPYAACMTSFARL